MMAVDSRGFPRARRGAGELAGGLGEAAKDWATTETGATVVGVAAGIFAGEWIGSWITERFEVEDGWTKILYKAVGKALVSFVAFYVGRRVGGIGHILLNGVSAGALASILGDVVGEYVAPGLVGRGNVAGIQGITIKANNAGNNSAPIGARTSVITSI